MYCAPAPLGEVLAHEVLGQGRGAEVGGLLAEADLLQHRRRRHHPAHPDAGREDLGEGAEVEHVVAAVERVQRLLGLALEAQQPVGVVLADQHLVLAGELDQPLAPLGREGDPGRVLEARHRVDELGPAALAWPAAPAPPRARRSACRPRRWSPGSRRPRSCRRSGTAPG